MTRLAHQRTSRLTSPHQIGFGIVYFGFLYGCYFFIARFHHVVFVVEAIILFLIDVHLVVCVQKYLLITILPQIL